MGDTGKRYHSQRGQEWDNKNQKRRTNEKDEKGGEEMVIYRILCPDGIIGSVIGNSGKVINSIRQETRAKIKVLDLFPGAEDRVITIYSYVKDKEDIDVDDEDVDREPLCAAQDALLKVHTAISKSLASPGDSDKRHRHTDKCQLLVPSSQVANIIGKAGATIKKLRSKTRTHIKFTEKDSTDPTHSCAMEFDSIVVIAGTSNAVKKALFVMSSIMYKFTPKEEIPLDTSVPEAPPSIIIPSDLPIYQTGGFYPGSDPIVSSRSVPPVIGATHMPELHGYGDTGSTWPLYTSALPVDSGYGGASRSEELVVRVLCSFEKIGHVIGKGGGTIKSIRQATGACIEVDGTKEVRKECIITITCTESPDDLKSMAVQTVLLLQNKINDDDDETATMQLLVPSKIIGCIIGKSGAIVNEIRKRTRAGVCISKGDKPRCADSNYDLVEVVGEHGNVRDALVQIILRLRDDVLYYRDNGPNHVVGADSLYSGSSALTVPSVLPTVSQVAQLGFDQRSDAVNGLGLHSSSSFYDYGSIPMAENGYGSMSSYSSKRYGGLPPPTNDVVIPANAVGKVLGKGGTNIAAIQKISGAVIEIYESESFQDEHIAYISGTPDQRRAAENMIQAFILAT